MQLSFEFNCQVPMKISVLPDVCRADWCVWSADLSAESAEPVTNVQALADVLSIFSYLPSLLTDIPSQFCYLPPPLWVSL